MAHEASPVITLAGVRAALRDVRPRAATAPGAQPAAVSLVLVEGAQGVELLLIRRAERAGDPWSGQVALPGGRQDPADSDLLATAIREAREETGVDLRSAERLGVLDDLAPVTPTLPRVLVRPFVFALPQRPELVTNEEVQRAFWVPLARLVHPGTRRDVTRVVRGVERTFPAYVVDDEVIWGMTERILTPLINRL